MRVLVLGATSAIAQETAKCFAVDGAELFLVGRSAGKLGAVHDDLLVRGASKVETRVQDLADTAKHSALIKAALKKLGGIDMALVAYGTLGDQAACEQSVDETMRELQTNFLSVISLLTLLANYFEAEGTGCLAVITSVAGDRGRQSNYVYGTAKGGVGIFLQGLRQRLNGKGVRVITVKPGFVDTPMTAGIPKNPLFASAERVGRSVYDTMLSRKPVVYLPWFWRPVMWLVRNVPERIFNKLNL